MVPLASHNVLGHHKTCGSWLACDASDTVWLVNRSDPIASKPDPTWSPLASRSFFEQGVGLCKPPAALQAAGVDKHQTPTPGN